MNIESREIDTLLFALNFKHGFQSAENILYVLKRKKYNLAIVLSAENTALEPFKEQGLLKYFDAIVTKDDGFKNKLDSERIDLVLEQLGSSGEKAMMIVDSPLGLRTGHLAGVTTVGVQMGTTSRDDLSKADFLIGSLQELDDLLAALNKSQTLSSSCVLQGMYRTGLGESTDFLSVDWVSQNIQKLTTFRPYPGTFNVHLLPSATDKFAGVLQKGIGVKLESKEGFCDATLIPAHIYANAMKADAYVLYPHVEGYPQSKLELIAPTKLYEELKIKDQTENIFICI